jgi:glycosyltransferase involved in cell wall biosynthesis
MIRGRDFVVFADDWHGLPTSANHLFRRIAQHNRVFWFNTIGRMPSFSLLDGGKVVQTLGRWMSGRMPTDRASEVPPGVHVCTPMMIPWFKPVVRSFNRWSILGKYHQVRESYGIERPIVMTTFPYTVDVVRAIPDALRVYYCVDDFLDYPGVAKADWARMEAEMLNSIDGLIVTSRKLAEKQTRSCPLLHLPHGVEHEHFSRAMKEPRTIAALEKIPRPIVGFFGLISSWVDLDLVNWLSERFPHVSFVLIGRPEMGVQVVRGRLNVYWLGLVPYAELPWYARYFDVGLIPFVLNQLTRAINPLKLLEYYSLGLPVLSTRLPELVDIPGPIKLAETRHEFESGLRELLEEQWDGKDAGAIAAENTWDRRVDQLGDFLEELSEISGRQRQQSQLELITNGN